jgi:ubiquinone/menaquinone biosynthesis C-methylase UbiE
VAETDPAKETWDSYWSAENPEFAQHDVLVRHVLKHVETKNSIIAEIGAGSGVDALGVAREGNDVVIMDMSDESLKIAKSLFEETGLEIMAVRGDALKMPFKSGSIDFLYHQGLMEHFKDPYPLLSESKSVLKSGGKILVDVPQTFTLYTLKKKWAMARGKWFAGWETQYSPNKLRRVLRKAGFKVVDFYGRDYDFLPFIWLKDIKTLGKTRFGRPILPRFISETISKIWNSFEKCPIHNYLRYSIGAVGIFQGNSAADKVTERE